MKQRTKLILACVVFVGLGLYWLVPWQQLSLAIQRSQQSDTLQEVARERRREIAEYQHQHATRPVNVGNCIYDERIDGPQPTVEKVAPNGVTYWLYPGGAVGWSGDTKPNVSIPRPPKSYGRARVTMMKRIAELYVPEKHGPLADHVHEDSKGRYVELDGQRIDVVTIREGEL